MLLLLYHCLPLPLLPTSLCHTASTPPAHLICTSLYQPRLYPSYTPHVHLLISATLPAHLICTSVFQTALLSLPSGHSMRLRGLLMFPSFVVSGASEVCCCTLLKKLKSSVLSKDVSSGLPFFHSLQVSSTPFPLLYSTLCPSHLLPSARPTSSPLPVPPPPLCPSHLLPSARPTSSPLPVPLPVPPPPLCPSL